MARGINSRGDARNQEDREVEKNVPVKGKLKKCEEM